jgi:predicted TPR repeat methyltransferase
MTSTRRTYFEDMYRDEADPWGFESSGYEHRKYALTVASLPQQHYGAVYEPGCSVGVLSELLSARCDRLLATDIISDAVGRAASRLCRFPHAVVEQRAIPEDWPKQKFDLIVLSEIAYYFDEVDLAHLIALALESADVGAHIVGVHWRGATDYPLTGDHAHEILNSVDSLRRIVHHVEPEFLLDVWERV